ncbi:MAG: heme-binding protein [Pseudomonadota bacterium]
MPDLGSEEVMSLLKVGLAKATEMGEPSCIAVVDQGGNIAGFVRSDSAMFGTAEIAVTKAYTAAAFKMPNGDLSADGQPGREAYGFETAGRGRNFSAIAGGFPLIREGKCIGAIGVCGGPVATDVIIAQAMLEIFKT